MFSNLFSASHPVISSGLQNIRLCSECENGVCAPFHSSSVSICCQSSTAFCGPGSEVEMDGMLARDCSKMPCSAGYECSLAPYGDRVCCSLAQCSSGKRARAICAAGCRQDEVCEVIHAQRWCCPMSQRRCPRNRLSNGAVCSSTDSYCDDGYECVESNDRTGYLCCKIVEKRVTPIPRAKMFSLSTSLPTYPTTTEFTPIEVTFAPAPVISSITPQCFDDNVPLMVDGEFMACPQINAPCPKAGFTCQAVVGGLYCCPMDAEEEEEYPESTESPTILMTSSTPKDCTGCEPTTTERPTPRCPYAFREARRATTDEIKTCIGFLDFSCPFGYSCLPSSTTKSFLCCAMVT
ncbi:hypothetical protein Q1695_007513 [Nippostrongylus brasiliensis]|nr:hypothetical protein Q1695_007513 [Nippostrongylus brasiliensis]